jgi:hypothetical protein
VAKFGLGQMSYGRKVGWKAIARHLCAGVAVGAIAACHTQFESRAASDYAGYPHRVIVAVPSGFGGFLVRDIETCGIAAVSAPNFENGAAASNGHPTEGDGLLTYRTVGNVSNVRNAFGVTRTEVTADIVEAQFAELPSRRTVWRGRFQIGRTLSSLDNAALDLVRRFAEDGILRACSGKL